MRKNLICVECPAASSQWSCRSITEYLNETKTTFSEVFSDPGTNECKPGHITTIVRIFAANKQIEGALPPPTCWSACYKCARL